MAVAVSNMGATWNTSPTAVNTAIKINVTDTSSQGNSKLIDLQINGASKFNVDKHGNAILGSNNWGNSVYDYKTGIIVNGGDTTGGGYDIGINGWYNSITAPAVNFIKSRGTTVGTHTAVQNGDNLMWIVATGANGSSSYNRESAAISAFADGTPSGASVPGGLAFWTTAAGDQWATEQVRITSSGNVGIGVTAPAVKLDVSGTIRTACSINFGTGGGNYQAGTIYSDGNWGAILRLAQTTPTVANFRIHDATDNPLMAIDKSGNTGFGTTTPRGRVEATGEITSQLTTYGNFRAIAGNYGIFTRNDGAAFYTLITASGDQYGSWSTLRPFTINLTDGTLSSQPTWDNTTTGTAVVVTSTGLIRRTSSSIKYKKDVETLDHELADNAIANLRPVWYRTKSADGDDKETWSHIGLIAEEVHEVEPRLVHYRTQRRIHGENGEPDTFETLDVPEPEDVYYPRLSVLLLDVVQRQTKKIKDLEARLEALENKA